MTQACHAVSAVLWQHREDPTVVEYMASIDDMHKVTLQVKNENQLRNLAKDLEDHNISHYLWTEKPEMIPTAIATKPYRRSELGDLLKKCQLFS